MEIRQLRYAVTLADQLHFGRAAEREHIVQSALSQQIRRLEREIGARLFDRNTHQVSLTLAGRVFIAEAQRILRHLDRAAAMARHAVAEHPVLRLGFTEASYEHIPAVVETVVAEHPGLHVHQRMMSLPQQFEALDRGYLDIGVGLARFAPAEISTARLALDPAGVFVGTKHPWASLRSIPVRELRSVILLRGDGDQAPEYNDFVVELCGREGFSPNTRPGSVDGVRAAIDLVQREDVAFCAPRAVWPHAPHVRWVALADPVVHYKQSVLWRAGNPSPLVHSFVRHSRELASRTLP
ncbi:LysR substrate-binding domain-containing protein [Pseudonocardia sp. RS11V-5]|uniref:LysR family transcriptional regulator n=1 Tax=Pseudonocardia terrae TaxID=2905831 RepID=UPI001E42DDAA|nr:LysR substrate-binding domain-containing protein [Pseudonocardia terrae]MCE3552398.1 LysR substrate-binding domain-containing protein [Pseudonocardia terrae]